MGRALLFPLGPVGGVMLALRSALCVSIAFLATGCNTVFWGNLGVFCVTVGIFLGTVFLSRTRPSSAQPTASASSSTPSSPRS